MLQSFVDTVSGMVFSVVSVFIAPTILLLLLRHFLPLIGEPLWRLYCQFVVLIFTAPVKIMKALYREARRR